MIRSLAALCVLVGAAHADRPSLPQLEIRALSADDNVDSVAVGRVLRANHKRLMTCFSATDFATQSIVFVTVAYRTKKQPEITVTGPAEKCVAKLVRKLAFGRSKDGEPGEVVHTLHASYDVYPAESGILLGVGETHFRGGTASGAGFGRTPRAPAPTPNSAPTTRGALAPEVIRRHVRKHIATIRACYETTLEHEPTLSGRVSIAFTIGRTGAVTQARTTGFSASVDECLTKAVQAIVFPAPRDGATVTVTYPFTFAPASQ